MHMFDPLYVSSDLPGANPATLNGMILYYRLMTKWSGLRDSTELSWMGLSHDTWEISLPSPREVAMRKEDVEGLPRRRRS
jgi:hypothetical protein